MFGIARSSLHMPVQLLSFCFALVGFFFAKLYGHSTPHLYKGNSHHTLGWILFVFMIAQMSVGVVRKIANAIGRSNSEYERLQEQEQHQHFLNHASSSSTSSTSDRHSEASGETLNMNEFHEYDKHNSRRSSSHNFAIDDEDDVEEDDFLVHHPLPTTTASQNNSIVMRAFNKVSPYIPKIIKNGFVLLAYNPFTKVVCRYFHMIMGRTFIVLIFVQTLSGLVVYHGVCR